MEQSMLIVDDTEINRAVIRAVFTDTFDIIEAESAKEAIQIL